MYVHVCSHGHYTCIHVYAYFTYMHVHISQVHVHDGYAGWEINHFSWLSGVATNFGFQVTIDIFMSPL